MRFFVLGPLAVADDDGDIAMDSAKQRRLLAYLLSRPGVPSTMDALTDALWDGAPPQSAHKALRWHIHRLRRVLRAPQRVRWHEGGYLLDFSSEECDSQRFERLHREGAAALRADDLATAERTLRQALALWHGAAYAGLTDNRWLRTEADRLEELRLSALEDSCQAGLALGRHHDLIPELTGLVADNPLRERFREQLMLGLYRCGRQVEALQVYREGREALVAELGIEPGVGLRRLEHDILNADPDLDLPEPTPPHGGAARSAGRPAELPPANRAFTGRAQERQELIEGLTPHGSQAVPIVAVSGAGGSGKSDLAVHVAHLAAEHFPDGQLYVNLHGATPHARPLEPAEVLARFLRSLGAPGASGDVNELAAWFRSKVADKRMLVVCDDAHDAAQVRPLLPGGSGCAVLITSRRRLVSLDGAAHLRLGALDDDDAMSLLTGTIGPERVAADPESTAEIARLCGRLPLALCVAAARLNIRPNMTVGQFAEQLVAADQRLDELEVDDKAVRASLAVSYRDLECDAFGAEAARLFRMWGLLEASDVGVETAAALAEVSPGRAGLLLDLLVDARLAENGAPGRYRMHDLLRLYAAERARSEESESARTAAVERAMRCYLTCARAAARLLEPAISWEGDLALPDLEYPGVSPQTWKDASRWLESECANLESVARQAALSPGDVPRVASALSACLYPMLHQRGRWREKLGLSREAVKVSERLGDPLRQAVSFSHYGSALRGMQRLPEALVSMRCGLTVCRRNGLAGREAILLAVIGSVHLNADEPETAAQYLQESLVLSRQEGILIYQGSALVWLGMAYMQQSRLDEAAAAHREALEIARQLDSASNQAVTYGYLADVHRRAGRFAEAVSTYMQGLERLYAADLADSFSEAEQLWGLGDALWQLGRHAEARRNWSQSVSILAGRELLDAQRAQLIREDPHPTRPDILGNPETAVSQ